MDPAGSYDFGSWNMQYSIFEQLLSVPANESDPVGDAAEPFVVADIGAHEIEVNPEPTDLDSNPVGLLQRGRRGVVEVGNRPAQRRDRRAGLEDQEGLHFGRKTGSGAGRGTREHPDDHERLLADPAGGSDGRARQAP